MASTDPFPERHILNGFAAVEQSLDEVLRHIPYCGAHEIVWSPLLADCIIDACHQLDSLWKVTARRSPSVSSGTSLTIRNYFDYFGPAGGGSAIAGRWVVFWGEQPL